MTAWNPELIKESVNAQAARGEAGEQVKERQGALGVRRRGAKRGERTRERRSGHVGPPHRAPREGSTSAGRVCDNHSPKGNPLQDGSVHRLRREGQEPGGGMQARVRGTQRREPGDGVSVGTPEGSEKIRSRDRIGLGWV